MSRKVTLNDLSGALYDDLEDEVTYYCPECDNVVDYTDIDFDMGDFECPHCDHECYSQDVVVEIG